MINGVLIELLHGDITNEDTEAIVNPTNKEFVLNGKLSQAIIANH